MRVRADLEPDHAFDAGALHVGEELLDPCDRISTLLRRRCLVDPDLVPRGDVPDDLKCGIEKEFG